MRDLNGPLWVVRKDRYIEINANIARVFNRHVQMHLLSAINGDILREMIRTYWPVIVVKVDVKGLLWKHGNGDTLCEIHQRVRERGYVAGDGIGVACRWNTFCDQGDEDTDRHREVLKNVERFEVQL